MDASLADRKAFLRISTILQEYKNNEVIVVTISRCIGFGNSLLNLTATQHRKSYIKTVWAYG